MNAKIEEKKPDAPKSLPFPKLMKAVTSELVVLFESEETGIVVYPNGLYPVGRRMGSWLMATFTDLPATQQVVLSN